MSHVIHERNEEPNKRRERKTPRIDHRISNRLLEKLSSRGEKTTTLAY